MGDAYKYAISTVVAAVVSTSTVGCFFGRERDSVQPVSWLSSVPMTQFDEA